MPEINSVVMLRLFLVFIFIPVITVAEKTNVLSPNNVSFTEAVKKAKRENKYVFVSCVLSKDDLSTEVRNNVLEHNRFIDSLEEDFIIVTMVMDSLADDRQKRQQWYLDQIKIKEEYSLNYFPSFLVFSPSGSLVHKAFGLNTIDLVSKFLSDARIPEKQYCTLKSEYDSGKKSFSVMPYLVETAEQLKDNEFATLVAQDYMENYLAKLPDSLFFNQKNINFSSRYTLSKNKVFKAFYAESKKVDSVMNTPGFADAVVDFVISHEEIDPLLWRNLDPSDPLMDNPDWDKIKETIVEKYNKEYADRTVVDAKLRWYVFSKEWDLYTKALIQKIDQFGPSIPFGAVVSEDVKYNWNAFDLFKHATSYNDLMKALALSEKSIKIVGKPDAGYYDTYANLLYKLGRRKEAVEWERKAVAINPADNIIRETLDKMNKNLPTW